MKILFTGGGTGGHFYPIIAVAQNIKDIIYEKKLVGAKFYFLSDQPYNSEVLRENNIEFIKTSAGKWRRYFSLKNLFSPWQTLIGTIKALWTVYFIYPDVVFSKGGYASLPTLWAARLLRIPAIIHESDSHPGRANLWAGRFAKRIALSYPEALKYFPEVKTAVVGNPIRKEIMYPVKEGAREFLRLQGDKPIILVLGGSQGAVKINETILNILPELVKRYQVIHQTGKNNFDDIVKRRSVILADSQNQEYYKPFPYLNNLALRMAAGAAALAVSRAGSSIFEIAYWGIPSIIIPIPETISHDQRTNAVTFARSGAAVVIEENNLTPSVLLSEIDRLFNQPDLLAEMKKAAANFARPEAGRLIAEEIINIALSHEG